MQTAGEHGFGQTKAKEKRIINVGQDGAGERLLPGNPSLGQLEDTKELLLRAHGRHRRLRRQRQKAAIQIPFYRGYIRVMTVNWMGMFE